MKKITLFALVCIFVSIGVKGQDLPTIGEVFDFNVGDEYHYNYGSAIGPFYEFARHQIIDVVYSLDSTEVTHTTLIEAYEIVLVDDTIFLEPDTIITTYTNLDLSMFYYDVLFEHDTLHYYSDSLCGVEIFGAYKTSSVPDVETKHKEYGIGLGLVYNLYWGSGFNFGTLSVLVYYKKDGIECGSPVDISVGIDPPLDSPSFSVLPTLFTDKVTIESDYKDDITFILYSLSGREIVKEQLTSSTVQMDLGFVSSGIYVYVIQSDTSGLVIKSGKIVRGE